MNQILNIFAAIAIFLVAFQAKAEDIPSDVEGSVIYSDGSESYFSDKLKVDVFGMHIASKHFTGKWNDTNPGVYIKLNNGFVAGTYLNSYSKQSVYAGKHFNVAKIGPVSLDVTAGVISGYSKGLMPMVIPSVAMPISSKTTTRVAFVPQVKKGGSAAVHLMVEYKL